MPYKSRADRLRHSRAYGKTWYQQNAAKVIARTRARKQRLRLEERQMSRCRYCKSKMIVEEVGGRKWLECQNGNCNRRILLDPKATTVALSQESQALLNTPGALRNMTIEKTPERRKAGRPPKVTAVPTPVRTAVRTAVPTPVPLRPHPGRKPRAPLSAESRARIGQAVREAAIRRRAARTLLPPCKPPASIPEPQVEHRPKVEVLIPIPQTAVQIRPTTTIAKALELLMTQEEQLQQQLDTNRARQGALRDTALLLEEVGA